MVFIENEQQGRNQCNRWLSNCLNIVIIVVLLCINMQISEKSVMPKRRLQFLWYLCMLWFCENYCVVVVSVNCKGYIVTDKWGFRIGNLTIVTLI